MLEFWMLLLLLLLPQQLLQLLLMLQPCALSRNLRHHPRACVVQALPPVSLAGDLYNALHAPRHHCRLALEFRLDSRRRVFQAPQPPWSDGDTCWVLENRHWSCC